MKGSIVSIEGDGMDGVILKVEVESDSLEEVGDANKVHLGEVEINYIKEG